MAIPQANPFVTATFRKTTAVATTLIESFPPALFVNVIFAVPGELASTTRMRVFEDDPVSSIFAATGPVVAMVAPAVSVNGAT